MVKNPRLGVWWGGVLLLSPHLSQLARFSTNENERCSLTQKKQKNKCEYSKRNEGKARTTSYSSYSY